MKIATDTGIKFKVKTSDKKRYQQLLELITIDILKLEQQHPPSQYIITLPMNPIINSSFKKHPMSWDIIHIRLLHPSNSFMKSMCRHQTLYGLPKYCPKKIQKSPCTICYTEKWQLSTSDQQLTQVTFNQYNLSTWTLNFTTSLTSVILSPWSQ